LIGLLLTVGWSAQAAGGIANEKQIMVPGLGMHDSATRQILGKILRLGYTQE
jgi:hypothetical protein